MLSYFNKAYCINLTSREDRLHRVLKEFEQSGLSKFFQRFEAVNPKRYDYDPKYNKSIGPYHVVPNAGCLGSHRAIIKEAKEQGLENVLVFEDDVKFVGDKEAASESINDLKNTNWGLFYLGATIEEEMREVTPRLFQTKFAKATHAVAYNKKVYDDILNTVPEDINELLEFTCEYIAVDNFLIKEIQSKYETFICNPIFAVQGRSFSDIVQMNIDYSQDQIRLFNENKPQKHSTEGYVMKSYSQYGQDVVVLDFFKEKGSSNGYFMDVGASDGILGNNTRALEEQGWKGICVEAHPSYYNLLKQNRDKSICYGVAAGGTDKKEVEINLNYRGALTSLDFNLQNHFQTSYREYYGSRDESEIRGFKNGPTTIEQRSIDSILDECSHLGQLNFLCIDIDGSEKYAFEGLSLNRWKPELLLLEHSVIGSENVDNYATKNGYFKSVSVGSDTFYTRTKEDAELLKKITPGSGANKFPNDILMRINKGEITKSAAKHPADPQP